MKLVGLFLVGVLIMSNGVDAETLSEALAARSGKASKSIDAETKGVMSKAISELEATGIKKNVPKEGATLPNGTFVTHKGKTVELESLLTSPYSIVTFYRGSWCPYCNIQLHYYQKHLEEFKKHGARLIAISPEKPDASLEYVEEKGLDFPVLTDTGSTYGRKLGIMYTLPPQLVEKYKAFGIELQKNNDSGNWELPLTATFIIDKTRKVVYSFSTYDYKKRATPEELLSVLKRQ